jgi:lysophospholipase L1-like esterase
VVEVKPGAANCSVLSDSIVRNVGAANVNMMVEWFPGIRAGQMHRVMENSDFEFSDSVVIHVGTNDVRRSRNLDYVMGEVYDLMNTVKAMFPGFRLVLSGVLRSKGVSWRRVGAISHRLEWVAGNLGVTFVDPNSWIGNGDFSRDGLHLNRDGARQLGDLYCRVCGTDGEG